MAPASGSLANRAWPSLVQPLPNPSEMPAPARIRDRANNICICALLLLAGCSANSGVQIPTVELDTPTGVTTLYSPAPEIPGGAPAVPPPGLMIPPPDQSSTASASKPARPRSGTYAGIAEPLDTGGGLCISNRKVAGFHVHGSAVQYGRFHGTIAADNGLQMVLGQTWIFGQFEGPIFRGQLDIPGNFGAPGCTYMLTLERVGA
jgi:hypothetical protein